MRRWRAGPASAAPRPTTCAAPPPPQGSVFCEPPDPRPDDRRNACRPAGGLRQEGPVAAARSGQERLSANLSGTAMTAFAYRDGELCAERVPLAEIARDVGTPFYCYSSAALATQRSEEAHV